MPKHPDPEVQSSLTRLLDALCTWERETGRRSVGLTDAELFAALSDVDPS